MDRTVPDDSHIFRMTDCTGMFQHAKCGVPDPSEGYTTDDNARALVMAALLYQATKSGKYLDLAYRYLSFLLYAQNGGWFRNFMDYSRRFVEERGSQDCFGRCLLCLGYAAGCTEMPDNIRRTAGFLLEKAVAGCRDLKFLRSKAYALIGLGFWRHAETDSLLRKMGREIADSYMQNSSGEWHWFEQTVTYCNAALPWSMFSAYEGTGEKEYLKTGLDSLDFLLDITFPGGIFRPVGCKGWMKKGDKPPEYDQQPVEACGTLLACKKAYELTGRDSYRERAKGCLGWYTGKNTSGINMIDPETGGCMDGITPQGPNRNEGAESLVCWIIASLAMKSMEKKPTR